MRACWAAMILVLVQPSPASCATCRGTSALPRVLALTHRHLHKSPCVRQPFAEISGNTVSSSPVVPLRKLCPFLCVSSRVHSIFLWPEPLREPFRRWLPFRKALESSRKNRNFFRKRSYERNEVLGEGCARKNPSLIGIPEASARRMR